jgi:hypothetical protein
MIICITNTHTHTHTRITLKILKQSMKRIENIPGTSHQKINKRAKRTYLSIQESNFQTKYISLFYKNKE